MRLDNLQKSIGILLLLIGGPVMGATPGRPATESGWVLEQKDVVYGNSTVISTPQHTKYYNHEGNYAVVASAPKWELHFYNTANKLYFQGTTKQLEEAIGNRMAIGHLLLLTTAKLTWKKTGSSNWKGHPITIWTAAADTTPRGSVSISSDPLLGHVELWSADDVLLVPTVSRFLHIMNKWPESSGQAVRSVKVEPNKTTQYLLETKSIKRATFSDSEFEIPKGYKATKNEGDIFFTKNGSLEDAIDGLTEYH